MRLGLGILGFAVAVGTTAAVLSACGSSVAEAPGGNGGSGTGGAGGTAVMTVVSSSGGTTMTTTGTGTPMTTTGTGVSMTTSSSSGGGNPKCEQACMHIDQCMLGVSCSQIGFNCNVGNQYDCQLDCINSTPCSQLNFQTLQACNQKCQGMTVDGGPPVGDGGMPMGGNCQQCAIQKCQQPAFACAQNQACMGWLGCIGQCNQQDPACPGNCDAMYPQAKPLYDALYTCTCANCPMECAATDPCSHAP